MKAPVRRVNVHSARTGSSYRSSRTSAMMIAIAPVPWTAMTVVPATKALPARPKR